MENKVSERFDLEQDILKCWNVTDDIDLLYRTVMNGEPSKDDICNVLLGIKAVYDLRFEEMFARFEKMICERKIT